MTILTEIPKMKIEKNLIGFQALEHKFLDVLNCTFEKSL